VQVTKAVLLGVVAALATLFGDTLAARRQRLTHELDINQELLVRNVIELRDVLEHGVETGIDPALYLLVDQSLDLGQHRHAI